jgi:hypothetical protein
MAEEDLGEVDLQPGKQHLEIRDTGKQYRSRKDPSTKQ